MFLGNEKAQLIKPDESYYEAVASYQREMLVAKSSMEGMGVLKRLVDPAEWLRQSRSGEHPELLPPGRVPVTQFILADPETKRIYGMLQVRHSLNEYMKRFAGHIGYSVRPTERGKGYATKMLNEALVFCKEELKLEKVMVSCRAENEASRRTILACGGVLDEKVYEFISDFWVEKYWITLE